MYWRYAQATIKGLRSKFRRLGTAAPKRIA
jgi:hypothetical protein